MDFHAAAETCVRLCAPRPVVIPLEVKIDLTSRSMLLDTGYDRFTLSSVVGDLEWISAAHRLGGLTVKVLPSTSPSHISILAAWEDHMVSLTGIPTC
jgi:hypothetical protein